VLQEVITVTVVEITVVLMVLQGLHLTQEIFQEVLEVHRLDQELMEQQALEDRAVVVELLR
jgi:hypothetical protein